MEVPEEVKMAAKGLIEMYGTHFKFIGTKDGYEVFRFTFPKGIFTGFPFIYLYNPESKTATEISGIDALEAIASLDSKSVGTLNI